jgi:hypothetical protein
MTPDSTPRTASRRMRTLAALAGASGIALATLAADGGAQPALVQGTTRAAIPDCGAASGPGAASGIAGTRWDVADGAIPVWIQRRPAALGDGQYFASDLDRAVERGIGAWADVVPGLRLTRVADSSAAVVWVVWRRALAREPRASSAAASGGRTSLAVTSSGRATSALVELATRGDRDVPFGPADVASVVQHEVGHVLGLVHREAGSVTTAQHGAGEQPTRSDRAALRGLYARPATDACGASASARVAALPGTP